MTLKSAKQSFLQDQIIKAKMIFEIPIGICSTSLLCYLQSYIKVFVDFLERNLFVNNL